MWYWVQGTFQPILAAELPDPYMVNVEKVSGFLYWAPIDEVLNVAHAVDLLPPFSLVSFSGSGRSQWSPCCPFASFIIQLLTYSILKNILSRGMFTLQRASALYKLTIVKYQSWKLRNNLAEGVVPRGATYQSLCLPFLPFSSCYSNQKLNPYS